MRTMRTGTYNSYRPTYCYKIQTDGTVLRGLLKLEKTLKNCYDAYYRATDSISARVTAVVGTTFIRFEFVPLNTTLEVSTNYLMSLQNVMQFKQEDKAYIKLEDSHIKIIKGPSNWAELLRKIKAPKQKKAKRSLSDSLWTSEGLRLKNLRDSKVSPCQADLLPKEL
jgi:hypothetical protein